MFVVRAVIYILVFVGVELSWVHLIEFEKGNFEVFRTAHSDINTKLDLKVYKILIIISTTMYHSVWIEGNKTLSRTECWNLRTFW